MIYIDIIGRVVDKKAVTQYSWDIIQYFFKRNLKRDVFVDIRFISQFDDRASGYCHGNKDHVIVEVAKGATWPEQGYVAYNQQHQLITLAHELVHAKQYIRGEINPYDNRWVKSGISQIYNDYAHQDRPWEIEAHSLQDMLYNKYWHS